MNKLNRNKNKLSFDFLLLGILLVVCCLVFFEFITLQKVYLFKDIGSDTINSVYPHLIHVSEYLRTEGIPRWSFAQGLGQNITNSGIENPFNWLLYLLGKDYLAYGIIFVEILKILLTAWLCYRWLLVLFYQHWAAIFGAIAFALGGYMLVGGAWYVHSWFCFKLILLLWAFEKGFRKKIWLWWALAVFWALDVNFIFVAQAMLIYLIFRLSLREKVSRENIVSDVLKPAFSYGFLGLLMKAPFLFSIVYRIWESPRLSGGFSAGNTLLDAPFFETTNYYTSVILRIFGNDILGNGTNYLGWENYLEAPLFYCGVLTILLIPQAFAFMQKKEKIAYGSLLFFWIILIVFPYFRYAFYWFSGDYFKIVLSAFFPLACILCACRAVLGFQQQKKANIPILLATLFGLVFIYLSAIYFSNIEKIAWKAPVFLCLGTALLFILNKNKFAYKWSNLLLVLLLSVEMLCNNFTTVNQRVTVKSSELNERIGYNDYTLEAVDFINKNDDGFYRMSKRFSSSLSDNRSLNDGKVQGYFGTTSYSSFNQGHYVKFLKEMEVIDANNEAESRWIMGLHQRPLLEKLVSLKYIFGEEKNAKDGLQKVGVFGGKVLYKNRQTMPLGFIYKNYFPETSFKRLSKAQKDCSILNAVVLPDEVGKQKTEFLKRTTFPEKNNCVPNFIDNFKLTYFSQNKIIFEGSASNGLFFASIPYDSGWQATLTCNNQTSQPTVEMVNFGFLGVSLPKACANIKLTLSYHPPFAKSGLVIAIFAWSLLFLLFYKNRKKELV